MVLKKACPAGLPRSGVIEEIPSVRIGPSLPAKKRDIVSLPYPGCMDTWP